MPIYVCDGIIQIPNNKNPEAGRITKMLQLRNINFKRNEIIILHLSPHLEESEINIYDNIYILYSH